MNNLLPNIIIGILVAALIVCLSYIFFTEQPLVDTDCGQSMCEETIDLGDILMPQ